MAGSGGLISPPFFMATGDGDRLREARECVAWSVRQVAAQLVCNHTLVLRWETGDAPTPPAVLRWL